MRELCVLGQVQRGVGAEPKHTRADDMPIGEARKGAATGSLCVYFGYGLNEGIQKRKKKEEERNNV